MDGLSTTYFLLLKFEDASGKQVGSNLYWLSTKPETIDWAKSTWYTTPTSSYADYTALLTTAQGQAEGHRPHRTKGDEAVTHVMVENPTKSLAFFVRLKVNKGKGGEKFCPVIWQDNYISLLAGGEARSDGDLSDAGARRASADGRNQRLECKVREIDWEAGTGSSRIWV